MKPRSRSVFENYEEFQAWQELPQANYCNLLQRLNKNLSSYENKYRKYMHLRQSEMKKILKQNSQLEGQNQNHQDIPFLPAINANHNFIRHSQNIPKYKVIVAQQNYPKEDQIFCDRTNTKLKLKTISFNKNSKQRITFQRRKYSLQEPKNADIQKLFDKQQIASSYEKQNIETILYKIDTSNKMEGYKHLRCRLKKAANKRRIFHEEKDFKMKLNQQKQNMLGKKMIDKKVSGYIRDVEEDVFGKKTNEFSDKLFYEQNIKGRNRLQR